MSEDMKVTIAQAARKLMLEKNVKRLTVTNIVEACQITRQTFYYHFADIPALFRWILEKGTERLVNEFLEAENAEQGLRYFFLVAQNAAPFVERGMQSSYREELEPLLIQNVYRFFDKVVEREHLYSQCTKTELELILRYHSQAVVGILRSWTSWDREHIDEIVHTIFSFMTGKITPLAQTGV